VTTSFAMRFPSRWCDSAPDHSTWPDAPRDRRTERMDGEAAEAVTQLIEGHIRPLGPRALFTSPERHRYGVDGLSTHGSQRMRPMRPPLCSLCQRRSDPAGRRAYKWCVVARARATARHLQQLSVHGPITEQRVRTAWPTASSPRPIGITGSATAGCQEREPA
jgi:hypothetical protein